MSQGPPSASFGAAQSSLQIHTLSQVVTLNAADGGKGVGSLYFEALGKRAFAGPLAGKPRYGALRAGSAEALDSLGSSKALGM